ncbi:MAG: MmcB family DNA repair protein [Hyphomicrobiales bacterium]
MEQFDGRHSTRATEIERGVGRYLRSLNFAYVPELTLPDKRRADMVALGPKGQIWIVEIKSSVEDFKADHKWQDYQNHCDALFFATLKDVPADIFPCEAGLLIADNFGAACMREAPEEKLSAPMRKKLTLMIARFAATRFHNLQDPALNEKSVM